MTVSLPVDLPSWPHPFYARPLHHKTTHRRRRNPSQNTNHPWHPVAPGKFLRPFGRNASESTHSHNLRLVLIGLAITVYADFENKLFVDGQVIDEIVDVPLVLSNTVKPYFIFRRRFVRPDEGASSKFTLAASNAPGNCGRCVPLPVPDWVSDGGPSNDAGALAEPVALRSSRTARSLSSSCFFLCGIEHLA